MRDIALTIDEHGLLVNPCMHDGLLLGIVLREPRDLDVYLKDACGKMFALRLCSVDRLRATTFCEGNIILQVNVFSGHMIMTEHMRALYECGEGDSARLALVKARVDGLGLLIVEILPSYGCVLRASCQRIVGVELPG